MMTSEKQNHEYLGDGAYIEYVGYGFWLRANHHTDQYCTDKIFLEPRSIKILNDFCEKKLRNE